MYWLLLLLCCVPLGCTATCVRDTDCLGTSVCENNGCHLLVKGDAGRGSSETNSPSSSPPDQSSEDTSDGGSASASVDAGN
jgi:hypothetical protein